MVTLSAAQMAGIVSLAIIISGAVAVSMLEKSYYCAPEDNAKECIYLSSTNATCYFLGADDITKGDRCVGGTWKPLEKFLRDDAAVGTDYGSFSEKCLTDGEWCYCNPRGLIKNRRICN